MTKQNSVASGYYADGDWLNIGGLRTNKETATSTTFTYSLVSINTKNKDCPFITFKVIDEQESLKLKSYLELIRKN